MKKLIAPLSITLLFYAGFIFLINLTPYLTGPIVKAADAGGAIPANLWLSIALNFLSGVFVIAALFCQVWLGARFGALLDERREQRKKHDKGI